MDELDAETRAILRRKRELAQRTAEATRRIHERNRIENRETRLKYVAIERKRVSDFKAAMAANFRKHSDMYNNSPFRHDIGAIYARINAKKEKEAALDREHDRIYKILDAMTGMPEVDPVRLAPLENRERVMADPFSRIELERRQSRVDAQVHNQEYQFLQNMVHKSLESTRRKFAIIEQRIPLEEKRDSKPALEPHTDRTKFIRNHADYVAHIEATGPRPASAPAPR